MPDDEEGPFEELRGLVEDALLVETLMGWDGDPCECPECGCTRFRDGAADIRCPDCRAGRHVAVPR